MLCLFRIRLGDGSYINGANVSLSGSKLSPGFKRVANTFQMECPGKIISAACRHNQYRKLQAHQGWQMAMNSTVSAENDDRVDVRRTRWHAFDPLSGPLG